MNQLLTGKPARRVFRHFYPLGGRLHIVEVTRDHGLYSAKAFLEPVFFEDLDTHLKHAQFPVVAISLGLGYGTLHDAMRSLRKDMTYDVWARMGKRSAALEAVAQSAEQPSSLSLSGQRLA